MKLQLLKSNFSSKQHSGQHLNAHNQRCAKSSHRMMAHQIQCNAAPSGEAPWALSVPPPLTFILAEWRMCSLCGWPRSPTDVGCRRALAFMAASRRSDDGRRRSHASGPAPQHTLSVTARGQGNATIKPFT